MGRHTKINYTDSTVNPAVGCTGCELYDKEPSQNHCYAASLVRRFAGQKFWPRSFTEPEVFDHRLRKAIDYPDLTGTDRPEKPWLNGYPRIVFVNDLSDGFCPDVDPDEWLTPYLEEMETSPHIWLMLTKWPQRMVRYFGEVGYVPGNFWLGVTVMRDDDLWRLNCLQELDAVRWISAEPLLGSLDLTTPLHQGQADWVVAGGESGKNARPTSTFWADRLAGTCAAFGVPFFFKQWGAWLPVLTQRFSVIRKLKRKLKYNDALAERWLEGQEYQVFETVVPQEGFYRLGKESSGRLIFGVEWSGMPGEYCD